GARMSTRVWATLLPVGNHRTPGCCLPGVTTDTGDACLQTDGSARDMTHLVTTGSHLTTVRRNSRIPRVTLPRENSLLDPMPLTFRPRLVASSRAASSSHRRQPAIRAEARQRAVVDTDDGN